MHLAKIEKKMLKTVTLLIHVDLMDLMALMDCLEGISLKPYRE